MSKSIDSFILELLPIQPPPLQQQQFMIPVNNTSNQFLVQTLVVTMFIGFYATNKTHFVLNSIVKKPSIASTLSL